MRGLFSMSFSWEAVGVSLLCLLGGYLFHKFTGERFFAGLAILAGVWVLSGILGGLGTFGAVAGLLVFLVGSYLIYRYIWNSSDTR